MTAETPDVSGDRETNDGKINDRSTKRTSAPRHRYGWASIAVAIVFGLLYAYVLWGAIGDMVSLPANLGSLTPWWLLIIAVAVPVVAYVVAFVLGFRASLGRRALYLFIGLTVVACSTVGSIAYIQTHFVLL